MAEDVYELSLKGPGITINKGVDARTAAAIAQMAVGGAGQAPRVQSPGLAPSREVSANAGQLLSLREFLQQVNLSIGNHAKITAVGRYMRDFEAQADFSRDDIRGRFRAAGEPQPANFPRDFQKAIRAGWIAEDPKSPSHFYITRTGDELIGQGIRA